MDNFDFRGSTGSWKAVIMNNQPPATTLSPRRLMSVRPRSTGIPLKFTKACVQLTESRALAGGCPSGLDPVDLLLHPPAARSRFLLKFDVGLTQEVRPTNTRFIGDFPIKKYDRHTRILHKSVALSADISYGAADQKSQNVVKCSHFKGNPLEFVYNLMSLSIGTSAWSAAYN